MREVIVIYVMRKEVEEYDEVLVQVDPGHVCANWHGTSGTTATVAPSKKRVLLEEDKKALEITRAFAKAKRLKLKVYDLSTFIGKIRSFLKGVSKTPTVIIGKRMISGEITKNKLEKND